MLNIGKIYILCAYLLAGVYVEYLLKAILLGIIQGLTEFLPVSSSGHLVVFANILNFQESGIAFEVFVHFGTLISVLVAFRKELGAMILAPYEVWVKKSENEEIKEFLMWDFYIIVATIPAVIVGLFFKDQIEQAFQSILLVFVMLLITGLLMFLTQYLKFRNVKFNFKNTFIIGIAQSFAILPGISRSGSTIFTGMAQGMDREKVAKFSFIMSVPAILGAVVLKLNDMINNPPLSSEITGIALGTLFSAITGYLAIVLLMNVVKKGKLQWFGYYCFALGLIGLIWYFAR